MKIVMINGTPIHGVTYHMKTLFSDQLKGDNQVIEFYPKDIPAFCIGCKNCFYKWRGKMSPLRKCKCYLGCGT